MSRGLGVAGLLVVLLLVSTAVSHAEPKPVKARAASSQQQTIPAPHWGSAKTPGTKTAEPKAAATTKAAAKPAVCTHTVRSGESISRIATRYRVTRAALIQANQLVKPDALRSGQRLTVPSKTPASL